ncbi:glycoside hydrolase family 70 protein [Limosilactobacillus reuteri subsp. suis]|uniref:glycoside hydrolase family 70 protein n=1 Tax=Limosilactobacillus reuteri TaxID=1598 RepID=UPI0039921544
MDIKKHFKLYKSGKQWFTAAIITAVSAGLILNLGGVASADSATNANDNVAVNQPAAQTSENIKSVSSNASTNDVTNNQKAQKVQSPKSINPKADNSNQQQNRWVKNAQGQMEYYQNNQLLKGRQYVNLPTIPNTNVQTDNNWYLVDNGIAQSGVQQWAGSYYYFNPSTYLRVDNEYRQSQWGDWYMFGKDGRAVTGLYDYNGNTYYANPTTYLRETNKYISTSKGNMLLGNDGAALSGIQSVNGKYYYFDPVTHLQANKENYVQSQWGDWYLIGNDGQVLSGVQQWAGTYYYFDPTTYLRVDNDYRQSQWGDWYMFGHDGRIVTKVYPWAGTYYYFDPTTYLRVDNAYLQSQWGDWYLFGNDGRIQSGVQRWAGTYYYFDPTTYLRVDNDYVTSQWGSKYMFGPDGRIVTGLYKWSKNNQLYYFDPVTYLAVTNNYIKANNGNWYLFTADGTAASKVAPWAGSYYYFDPVTHLRVDNAYVQSQWGDWYMFGPDGRIVTGLKEWYGSYYYFDPTTYLKVTNKWIDNKYFGPDGRQAISSLENINNKFYYFDGNGQIIRNQFKKIDTHTYYFGSDGAALVGKQTIDGKNYHFASNGQLLGNLYGKIVDGKFNIYDSLSNKLIKTLDSGDWENMAYSQDSSSINNTDGYLSYSGWYRPYGTSQDGKTWYKTTASDWRPLLMYTWPSKDVEAKFIKYFVDNGYTNTDYGLTKDNVTNLSQDTDTQTLNKYARNLRFVIEKSIAANKSTGPLANDINKFMLTIPELSAKSELPVEYSNGYVPDVSGSIDNNQLIFINNNSDNQAKGNTSYADSNYRLMNRTINNQTNNDNSDQSPELLVGNDIDNSNPAVQAENFNWEYFLLNYGKLMKYNADGNFDGFRVDAADNIDADVLDQLGQLVNDMYHTKGNQENANNHLVYNEGYHSGAARMLNDKGNPELFMDAGYFYTLENVLGQAENKRDDVNNLITNSVVNRANDITENTATPNWSFVTNHDQRKNVINQIIIDNHPNIPDIMANSYKSTYAQKAWDEFYADQAKADKKYAQYNLPAQYALLLSNKDTVPQVYYGDLYKETDQYMKTKSMYYDAITTLMKARGEFVNGGQTMTKVNDNLITSVRYGKGVVDASSNGTDPLSRTTGMAVIVGNNPLMSEQVVAINMGLAHANEQYRNLIDSTADGLTYNSNGSVNPSVLTTDSKGILRITVKGYSNPYVSGYLSVWVPLINGTQNARTSAQEVRNVPGKVFTSNAALDSHMIYEDFSLFQPEPTTVNEHAYNVIKDNAALFNQLGITDFWMAPSYTPFNTSRYNEGYAMTDRYNLGTADNPTKYGNGEELSNAIAALHQAGLKVQEDLVMNQMIGFSTQEAVTVTRVDRDAKQLSVDGQTFADQIYFGYTRGGGQGQQDYGGKYLAELKQKYPDLFTTKAASTGVAPDPNTRITEWSAKYENGTSLQNVGIGLAVKMPNGYYAYLNDGNNKAFATTLPDAISSADYYANQENI